MIGDNDSQPHIDPRYMAQVHYLERDGQESFFPALEPDMMSLDLENWVVAPGTERFLTFREDADEEAAAVESLADREPPAESPSFFEAKKEIDDETSETSSYKSSDDDKPDCNKPPNLEESGQKNEALVSLSTTAQSD